MNKLPPPATRLSTPKRPPPPPICVWVVIWIEAVIRSEDHAGSAVGAVFGHEQAAAAGHALEHAEEAATSAHLRVGGHLDRSGHPGELAALAENALVGFKLHIEHGHGRALNFGLHGEACFFL